MANIGHGPGGKTVSHLVDHGITSPPIIAQNRHPRPSSQAVKGREENRVEVEQLWSSLSAEMLQLESHPEAHQLSSANQKHLDEEITGNFDELDVDPDDPIVPEVDQGRIGARPDNPDHDVPPERRPVILPSTHIWDNPTLCQAELKLRIKQATRYLAAIWEAVAEKSFQYSHVMRSAPSKGAQTRFRGVIATAMIAWPSVVGGIADHEHQWFDSEPMTPF